MNRRDFCFSAAAVTAASAAERVYGFGIEHKKPSGEKPLITAQEIAEIDRGWVLAAADKYLTERPITITAYHSPRSKGGKHDYFSEGDYWWPDPKHPGGPYIRRDGFSNPDNFNADREALIRLSLQVPALMAAYLITHEMKYARHAALHMRAWFLDPETRMNPTLTYAQAIWGRAPGRGIGIIDTLHLIEVTRAAHFLDRTGALAPDEVGGVKKWFAEYLNWMRTSKNGKEEEAAKNNHGTCWVAQAAAFAAYTENEECLAFCRERFKSSLLPTQMAPNGSFPLELARTKPYSYSLFDLDALAIVCEIASKERPAADDLWKFTLPDGDRYKKAIDFMYPYIKDKSRWPYKQDVEYWDDLPNRQPSLLFAGLAYRDAKYIALWKTLRPMPRTAEIVRNFPVRQPLLWVTAV
ncbi:MAG TPA: alginate lyase family protein [Terriglobales bacterium]|nr:alginate lyase family protein [Terriglobales bacterium]